MPSAYAVGRVVLLQLRAKASRLDADDGVGARVEGLAAVEDLDADRVLLHRRRRGPRRTRRRRRTAAGAGWAPSRSVSLSRIRATWARTRSGATGTASRRDGSVSGTDLLGITFRSIGSGLKPGLTRPASAPAVVDSRLRTRHPARSNRKWLAFTVTSPPFSPAPRRAVARIPHVKHWTRPTGSPRLSLTEVASGEPDNTMERWSDEDESFRVDRAHGRVGTVVRVSRGRRGRRPVAVGHRARRGRAPRDRTVPRSGARPSPRSTCRPTPASAAPRKARWASTSSRAASCSTGAWIRSSPKRSSTSSATARRGSSASNTSSSPRPGTPTTRATPAIMGQLMHFVGSPNRYGLPPFYELHVWAWRFNPNGAFVDWNPKVSCAEFVPAPPSVSAGAGSPPRRGRGNRRLGRKAARSPVRVRASSFVRSVVS